MKRLVIIGVAVHVLFLTAVIDVYFTSPLQRGMLPHRPKGKPPSKRVVLMVADGLRSRSLYGSQMKDVTPFLYSIVKDVGSWGISHTPLPTESRPGHVALLAGFSEDPSAIFKGWRSNPVDFDSVINRSTNAWCWGSPDIVDIFNKDNLPHIHLNSYDPYMQDFSGKNFPTLLDAWVFDKVASFLEQESWGRCTDVCSEGNIFFLHLLGLDTAGHSFKPYSLKYVKILKAVDNGIKLMVDLFDEFFDDKMTTFIFTSDHGMTDWGSHGDGSEDETNVPFIAWGAGIKKNATKQDIESIDIAPLISSLIGNVIPVNSLGEVPLNYISATADQTVRILQANAFQILEQYIRKYEEISKFPWLYQPFSKLSREVFVMKQRQLSFLVERQLYKQAISAGFEMISLSREGLKYYLTYHQNVLLLFLSSGFVGWIVHLLISIANEHSVLQYRLYNMNKTTYSSIFEILYFTIFILVCIILYLLSSSWKYYLYCTFPLFTWYPVLKNCYKGFALISFISSFTMKTLMYYLILYVGGIELMLGAFFNNCCLTVLSICILFHSLNTMVMSVKTKKVWVFCMVLLGICSMFLSTQTGFSLLSHLISFLLWNYYFYKMLLKQLPYDDKRIMMYQLILLDFAFINSWIVNYTITHGMGLFLINQLFSWIISGVSLVIPFFVSTELESRLVSSILALLVPYTLMAAGYESIFMFHFAVLMINWLKLENKLGYKEMCNLPIFYNTVKYGVMKDADAHTVRRCFYLLTFIMLGYFGVGNTAKMNSFDPMWVRCFVTVFSPFMMAGLILMKLVIPFIIVLCTFRTITTVTFSEIKNCFLIILLFTDLLVLQLLYFVKNEGSWLDIGASLSRFIVANVTAIVLTLLYQIAHVMILKRIPNNFKASVVQFLQRIY